MRTPATTPTPTPPARAATAALLAAVAASLAAPAHAMTPAEFFARISPSVWLVRTYDHDGQPLAQGSAVVIAPDTLVTNCHVLTKAGRFNVAHDSTVLPAKLTLWDTERDLCQVTAANLGAPAVTMGDSTHIVVGQPVYALGSPHGLELTLSDGLVSALRHDGPRLALIQTSAPITHGSSGGGLFDVDGRLIGITSSGFDQSGNLNFAIPVDAVRELPARHAAARQGKVVASAAPVASPPPMPLPRTIITTTTTRAPTPAPSPAPDRDLPTVPPAPAPVPSPAPQAPVAAVPPATGVLAVRVPYLNDARQAEFRRYYYDASYPKACAISDNGHYACMGGTRPRDKSLPSDPKERALRRCAELANKACMLYAVDDAIVFQPPATPAPAPSPSP